MTDKTDKTDMTDMGVWEMTFFTLASRNACIEKIDLS